MSRPRRHDREFTLVEIVVATALLAILILGLSVTMTASNSSETWSREQQAASEAAFAQLDLVRSTPIDSIQTNGGGDVAAYAFDVPYHGINLKPAAAAFEPLNAAPNAGRPGHVRVIDRGDYDGDGRQDLYEVQVVVAWRSLKLGNQRLVVSSMVTR